jgi:hypothetical protein
MLSLYMCISLYIIQISRVDFGLHRSKELSRENGRETVYSIAVSDSGISIYLIRSFVFSWLSFPTYQCNEAVVIPAILEHVKQ